MQRHVIKEFKNYGKRVFSELESRVLYAPDNLIEKAYELLQDRLSAVKVFSISMYNRLNKQS